MEALGRHRHAEEAQGEIETEHPGYLGAQDTYYVGTIKGIGRIYQQSFIDTYSKAAACKLYTNKTPITPKCIAIQANSRQTWTPGSNRTTMNGPIREGCAVDEHLPKPCSTDEHSGRSRLVR